MAPLSFKRHRFPPEIIRRSVWLYAKFKLSYRNVEEILAEHGVDISYETARRWFLKFGPAIVANLRRPRPRPSDHWHLDEMVVRSNGEKHWLWGLSTKRGRSWNFSSRHGATQKAARKLMKMLLKTRGFAPKRLVTDKLPSYPVTFHSLGLSAQHDPACEPKMGLRILIFRSDGENAGNRASSRPDRLSAFSPYTRYP